MVVVVGCVVGFDWIGVGWFVVCDVMEWLVMVDFFWYLGVGWC